MYIKRVHWIVNSHCSLVLHEVANVLYTELWRLLQFIHEICKLINVIHACQILGILRRTGHYLYTWQDHQSSHQIYGARHYWDRAAAFWCCQDKILQVGHKATVFECPVKKTLVDFFTVFHRWTELITSIVVFLWTAKANQSMADNKHIQKSSRSLVWQPFTVREEWWSSIQH